MNYAELPPPASLEPYIRCFWFLSGDDLGSAPQTIVADGRIEIILHLADPFQRIDANGLGRAQDNVLISGQLTSPIQVRPDGIADIVGVRFRTAAASSFFRLPLSELNDRVEPLHQVSRRLARELYDAAARQRTAPARARALSRVLERSLLRPRDLLSACVVSALDVSHAPSVADVAALHGVSARTIERRIQENTGLSPAVLRRVMRFRRAFRELDQSPPGTWTGVAARTGYYDQAHLIRDFRQFTGASPSEFFNLDQDLARSIMAGE
jgi:AraC-like DNA-binding protein